MDIYWVQDGKKMGPKPEVEIISLLENEVLNPSTLGWHKGCDSWQALKDLPALSSFFRPRAEPILPNEEFIQDELRQGKVVEGRRGSAVQVMVIPAPSPWMRFFARMFDIYLYVMVFMIMIFYCVPNPVEFLKTSELLSLFWLPWILLEMIFVRLWGTTPGKALCGIKVRSLIPSQQWEPVSEPAGTGRNLSPLFKDNPSWLQSFRRALQVACFGMGLYLPQLALVTMAFSFFLLKKRGMTAWDLSSKTTLISKQMELRNWILYIGLVILILFAVSALISPWQAQIEVLHNQMQQQIMDMFSK